jgi:hypothetical protein
LVILPNRCISVNQVAARAFGGIHDCPSERQSVLMKAIFGQFGMYDLRGGKWCRRGESNPRPRDYETLALPLSYAGTNANIDATDSASNVSSHPAKTGNGRFCASPPACRTDSGLRAAPDQLASPNLTSTKVLLTLAGPKPNLPLEQHSCPFSIGESLSKVGGGVLCIDSKQACSVSYLTLSL